MDEINLLTLTEAAALLRRSPAQLRWLRHQQTGPKSALISGRIFYRREDIERWVAEQFSRDAS
ncbi:helix-turn-helix transcriptional regulator [Amnibacterium kyonggiense]|uniref:Helix-turn-helix protein n=1 Tax=Amnibacterium kyonggiense TaxID=595671 RepID=A0A4V3EAF8_9MICO|nr:helix-turn-helix domain-containing protein [Amnibacterium kyonggiense]TDS75928.1 helix-turn-helix protein [Amnibacterium kyonggiense]